MSFLNLGIGEILFIIIIALIIFGPGNMVKTARDAGVFIRKVTKSPYWQEIWATKRELTELPKIIAKEAQIDQTINELNKETKDFKSNLTSTVSQFIKEVDQPISIENPISKASKQQNTITDAQNVGSGKKESGHPMENMIDEASKTPEPSINPPQKEK